MAPAKKEVLADLIKEARGFRLCSPSADPDRQTEVTTGYRHLVIQFKRLAGPILPKAAASRLAGIDIDVDDIYSAFDAKAEIDALIPDLEAALELFDQPEIPSSGYPRRYYGSRKKPGHLTLSDLYSRLQSLYLLYAGRDYFRDKAGITTSSIPDEIKHKAALALTFQPFPIDRWSEESLTEERVFETLEFLYDFVSKPGKLIQFFDGDYPYQDYEGFDEAAGRVEFMTTVNEFLTDYNRGFELTGDGYVVESGAHGLRHILNAEIVPYDESHVDSKVRNAIAKWRNRHSSLQDKREAIRELADVFEWLKKSRHLATVLRRKDESAIFDIANSFGIRHHDPRQKTDYDQNIWFSWIFHFYLATYHASIRLLLKNEKVTKTQRLSDVPRA